MKPNAGWGVIIVERERRGRGLRSGTEIPGFLTRGSARPLLNLIVGSIMNRKPIPWNWSATGLIAAALGLILGLNPMPGDSPAAAQDPPPAGSPVELQYVPADAAYFVHADVAAFWNHPIVSSIRKADAPFVDELTTKGNKLFGLTPDDVKSVTVFGPTLKNPRDLEKFGVVLTFKKGFEKEKLKKGVEQLLGGGVAVSVVVVNDDTALVRVNLGDEYAKPQRADASGPLTPALKAAASGKHALVTGITLANLPEQLQSDELDGKFGPFKPLIKSSTIFATLDLAKTIDIDVRVKTGTAAQAVECEKSLGVLLGLIQDEVVADGLKALEPEAAKNPIFKDLVTLLKAVGTAAREAKFSTLGNEARVRASIPIDLPFASAYLAAKQKVQEAAAASQSSNHLKQIGLAMHNYADTMGNLPPAAVCDKTGKPLLSWRVLILPYVEEEELFKQFKLDEPWDSAHNKKLLARVPKVYAIPGLTKPGGTDTHYRVFVGNGAGFDWVRGMRLPADFPDGTSNTLLCVTAATAVPWTKPDELEFDPEKDMTKLVGLVVNGRMQFGMFDGSVRSIAKIPDKQTFHALITRGGGEVINFDFGP
jgi:hypothetical protein